MKYSINTHFHALNFIPFTDLTFPCLAKCMPSCKKTKEENVKEKFYLCGNFTQKKITELAPICSLHPIRSTALRECYLKFSKKPKKNREKTEIWAQQFWVTKALHILESQSGIRTSVRKKSEQKLLR